MSNDTDMQTLSKSLRLLYAADENSGEELRLILEETIKAKCGTKKPISPISPKSSTKRPMSADDSPGIKKPKLLETTKLSITSPKSSSDSDSEDMTLEILEDDLTCAICRGMAVGPRNRLVECLECHCLFHQECHNPVILDSIIDDPRLVWYCDSCSKSMNHVAKDGYSSSGSPSSNGSGSLPPKLSKSGTSKMSVAPASAYAGASGSHKMSTVLTSKPVVANTNSKTNAVVVPKINIITADRRLQIMKKKAAKKQEKRKLTK